MNITIKYKMDRIREILRKFPNPVIADKCMGTAGWLVKLYNAFKDINKDILLQHKKNVQTVIFFLTSSKDVDFVSFLQYNGFNYQIVTALKDKELDDVKLDFIDYDVNRLISRSKDEFGDPSNLYFKTNKMLLSGGKVYNSKINWINGIEGMHEYNKVIDSPDFWDEVEHFYLCRIN